MTTQEFIKRQFGNSDGKDKSLSSVWKSGEGNIYSYGRHYPLLFTIDGVDFVNSTGYSNTTAKHINWAKAASNYTAIEVWLDGCNLYTWNNPENSDKVPSLLRLAEYGMTPEILKALKKAILRDLTNEIADIRDRMDAKTRKDTKIYASLVDEFADANRRLTEVQRAWGLI